MSENTEPKSSKEEQDERTAEVEALTLDAAETELSNALYAASQLLESLEYAGKVRGNGHHLRQRICQLGVDLLRERWILE